jgi:hypothetical protein
MGNCVQSYHDWKEDQKKLKQMEKEAAAAERKRNAIERAQQQIRLLSVERASAARALAYAGAEIVQINSSTVLESDKRGLMEPVLKRRHEAKERLKWAQDQIHVVQSIIQSDYKRKLVVDQVRELKSLAADMASHLPEDEEIDKLMDDKDDTSESIAKIDQANDDLRALETAIPAVTTSSSAATFDYETELASALSDVKKQGTKKKKEKKSTVLG